MCTGGENIRHVKHDHIFFVLVVGFHRVRKEYAELTHVSLHAAYSVIPQCYCLEIHTARATITPDHFGGLNVAMDQTALGESAESSRGSQPRVPKPSLPHPLSLCQCLVAQFWLV